MRSPTQALVGSLPHNWTGSSGHHCVTYPDLFQGEAARDRKGGKAEDWFGGREKDKGRLGGGCEEEKEARRGERLWGLLGMGRKKQQRRGN